MSVFCPGNEYSLPTFTGHIVLRAQGQADVGVGVSLRWRAVTVLGGQLGHRENAQVDNSGVSSVGCINRLSNATSLGFPARVGVAIRDRDHARIRGFGGRSRHCFLKGHPTHRSDTPTRVKSGPTPRVDEVFSPHRSLPFRCMARCSVARFPAALRRGTSSSSSEILLAPSRGTCYAPDPLFSVTFRSRTSPPIERFFLLRAAACRRAFCICWLRCLPKIVLY